MAGYKDYLRDKLDTPKIIEQVDEIIDQGHLDSTDTIASKDTHKRDIKKEQLAKDSVKEEVIKEVIKEQVANDNNQNLTEALELINTNSLKLVESIVALNKSLLIITESAGQNAAVYKEITKTNAQILKKLNEISKIVIPPPIVQMMPQSQSIRREVVRDESGKAQFIVDHPIREDE